MENPKMCYHCGRFDLSNLRTTRMATEKKRIITSYARLSEELEELFQLTYPKGYDHAVILITKPSGETFYAVRLETEDTSYLVKVEVKIDLCGDEEDETDDSFEPDSDSIEAPEQYGDDEESDSLSSYDAYDV